MPRTMLENSRNFGTLMGEDGRSVSVLYWLRRDIYVERDAPETRSNEEVSLRFPSGTAGITGSARFTTSDGRSVDCFIDGAHVALRGALE